jgi:hypothetical protein
MKKLLILGMLALVALPMGANAADEAAKTGAKSGTTKAGKPYFEASDKITAEATVVKVDKSTRYLSIRSAQGDTLKVKAGPEVKNFAQIAVGDIVEVTYTEKLTITVEAPGDAAMTTETMTTSAKPGEKPSGNVTERTQYKATITAIDKTGGTATLKGYDGSEFMVTPIHPENLGKVTVGELVVFTHTQAVAASVKKVAAKK